MADRALTIAIAADKTAAAADAKQESHEQYCDRTFRQNEKRWQHADETHDAIREMVIDRTRDLHSRVDLVDTSRVLGEAKLREERSTLINELKEELAATNSKSLNVQIAVMRVLVFLLFSGTLYLLLNGSPLEQTDIRLRVEAIESSVHNLTADRLK